MNNELYLNNEDNVNSDDFNIDHDEYNDYDAYVDDTYVKPEDDSPRFELYDEWSKIWDKAESLEQEGYVAGNRNWRELMYEYNNILYPKGKPMVIRWNPTHKQFALDSHSDTLDQVYPHLVGAVREE